MTQELREVRNPEHRRIVAALGVFDGVHIGHRRVLAQGVALGICHAVTFASDSMRQKQGHEIRYIYNDEQKRRLLLTCGADAVFALPFGEIRDLDGETFCRQILYERLQVDAVVCGENFRFGRNASCTSEDLARYGKKYGFQVAKVLQVKDSDALSVSSRHIRFLLESGEIMRANELLGADYQILSQVVRGQQVGTKTIGVPTANQVFEPWQCVPHYGVYASFAEINDIWIPAITNIGVRPTLGGSDTPVAETHLIDWSGDLDGSLLPVTLRKFMRPERKFESVDELSLQIHRDIQARRRLLPAEGKFSSL